MPTWFWLGLVVFSGMALYGIFRRDEPVEDGPVDIDYLLAAYGMTVPPHIKARMAQSNGLDEAKGELMDWIADEVRRNMGRGNRSAAAQIRDAGFRVIAAHAARRTR